ncbi:MAG: FkbM family methyltransferase [Phaeovulum sp.]|uniref:FkbM family methyltransferase n=1 Tax=Phaeovulum sp. TaxID=2934796 RepID=UPI00273191C9|nr:FkbM family methyltransferase [Phaeovulum sp.]MDP2063901.1 FkbM family methyltransferase [Phaeovulum sp.]
MSQTSRNCTLWMHRLRRGDRFKVHGMVVRVPITADAGVRYLLARKRPYEAPEAQLVRTYLTPGMNVVELGGSIGVISALIRAQIGAAAQHVIVEANPHLARICEANAAIGANPGTCRVIEGAIDYSGAPEVTFSAGANAHDGHLAVAGEAGFRVPAITLAEVAATLPPGDFALVCDIEGAEVAMLRHEVATLARVNLIVLETHPAACLAPGDTPEAAYSLLEAAGFRLLERQCDVAAFGR